MDASKIRVLKSALGQNRTLSSALGMSALPPKADIEDCDPRQTCSVPWCEWIGQSRERPSAGLKTRLFRWLAVSDDPPATAVEAGRAVSGGDASTHRHRLAETAAELTVLTTEDAEDRKRARMPIAAVAPPAGDARPTGVAQGALKDEHHASAIGPPIISLQRR